MQDLADLKRQALAQREFSVSLGSSPAQRHFTVRTPTHFENLLAITKAGIAGLADNLSAHLLLQRELLMGAVVGWSGVLVSDVLADQDGSEALDFSKDAVALVLDAQPAWEAELGAALLQKLADRRVKKDTAEKN